MNGVAFDSLSRLAAGAIPQRAQDRKRGTAVLASREPSVTAEGKNNKCRKRAKRRCKKQVAPCITGLTSFCNDEPVCVAAAQRCCPLLRSCDATGFLTCFVLE